MKISELNDSEKSAMLARLCGWLKSDDCFHSYFPPNGKGGSVNYQKGYSDVDIFSPNGPNCASLYNPVNMDLAWRVAHWASKQRYAEPYDCDDHENLSNFWGWELIDYCDFEKEADIAVREWLDGILELAIREGRIE